jgi:hypothetical protein
MSTEVTITVDESYSVPRVSRDDIEYLRKAVKCVTPYEPRTTRLVNILELLIEQADLYQQLMGHYEYQERSVSPQSVTTT